MAFAPASRTADVEAWDIANLPGRAARAAWRLAADFATHGVLPRRQLDLYDQLRRRASCGIIRWHCESAGAAGAPRAPAWPGRWWSHPLLAAICCDHPGLVYQHGEPGIARRSCSQRPGTIASSRWPRSRCLEAARPGGPHIHLFPACTSSPRWPRRAPAQQRRTACGVPERTDADRPFSSRGRPRRMWNCSRGRPIPPPAPAKSATVFARAGNASRGAWQHRQRQRPGREPHGHLTYQTRAELDRLTASRFHEFDYFRLAHGARTGRWGWSLPMFILGPCIAPSPAQPRTAAALRRGRNRLPIRPKPHHSASALGICAGTARQRP